ncbi:MAG: hypothetical protein Q7J25_07350 [Vicinamibacterales bacterium]|nr:hypothetical protein [Vicinamibacterales bacterium]
MRDIDRGIDTGEARMAARYRISVPWLAPHEQVGLGNAIKKITESAGVQECEPCSARAAALNRLVALSGQPSPANSPLNRLLSLVSVIAVLMLVREIYQRWRR